MLTDSQIRSAKPADWPRKQFDSRGLLGRNKNPASGVYPDVSLASASE